MLITAIPKALTIAFLEGKALELIGSFGIGKSSVIRQFTENLQEMQFSVVNKAGRKLVHKKGESVGLIECLVPTYAVEDIRGFPMPDYENGEMYYSVPPFFPSSRKYPDGIPRFGIIFLDEYRLGPDEVVKATTQLLLEGRIGDHHLSQYGHWVVFAASNREEDRVGIGKEPPIVTQRKMVISMEPSIQATLDWIEKNEAKLGISPMFRLFAQDNPGIILSQKTPDTGEPFCTPRSFVEAGQLCSRYMVLTNYVQKNAYDIPHDDAFLLELMASKIGESAAAQVQSYAGLVGLVPKYEDIISHPETAVCPGIERMDAAYTTITVIEHQAGSWSKDKDGNVDVERLDKEIDGLVTYLMRLPPEFQVVGLTRTFAKCPAVYTHPKTREIARNNPSVLKAVSGR